MYTENQIVDQIEEITDQRMKVTNLVCSTKNGTFLLYPFRLIRAKIALRKLSQMEQALMESEQNEQGEKITYGKRR